jgi:hypothetical protein
MDYGLLAKVEDELHRLRNEMRWAAMLEHRRFIIQLARQMRHQERVSRRRVVREFTRKQTLIGERILRDIEKTERLTRRGTKP